MNTIFITVPKIFKSLINGVAMNLTQTQIAEAFSNHEFERTYPYFLDTIQWHLIGNERLDGKEAVVNACQQSADYLAGVTTRFSKFTVIVGTDCVVIDSTADYVDAQQKETKIASCDLYTFVDGKLSDITSYSIAVN